MNRWGKLWISAALAAVLLWPVNSMVIAQFLPSNTLHSGGIWECYDDGSPDPCRNDLKSVEMISDNDGWAVGNNGTIMHWNGSTWLKAQSPTKNNLISVAMASATDGWAVGGWGNTDIIHWDGNQWSKVNNLPASSGLLSIAVVSSTDVWAVGYYGVILHWDGYSWASVPSGYGTTLQSISIVSPTEWWASGNNGTIIRWTSPNNWSSFSTPTTQGLRSITMSSSTEGWAVTWQGTMLHWDGNSWIVFAHNTWLISFSFIKAISPTDVWAAGQNNNANGRLIHWDGTSWSNVPGGVKEVLTFFSVVPGSGGNQGWAVGWGGRVAFLGGSLLSSTSEYNTVHLTSVEMISLNNGWIVGSAANSDGPILNWNGTTWAEIGRAYLNDTSFISANDGWAAGRSQIMHWNGNAISEVYRSGTNLSAIHMLTATDGWAVGGGTYIDCDPFQPFCSVTLHWDGSVWTKVTNPATHGLWDLVMVSSNDGWAIGANGAILHWNGISWSAISSPVTNNLYGIVMVSANDGWAVGASGMILHWNGISWSVVSSPVSNNLLSIAMVSATDGWIVGAEGTSLHWNGTLWSKVESPITTSLYSVAYASETEVWAVGENGVILRNVSSPPSLLINYPTGAPGSYFNLSGSDFPPNQTAEISINGHLVGSIPVGNDGTFVFTLSTATAGEGIYLLTASVNPCVTIQFSLDNSAEVRPLTGTFSQLMVPAGIAFTETVYLPFIKR